MPRAIRRGRPSVISRLSFADLEREMERRRQLAVRLEGRRADIENELAAVEAEIKGLGGVTIDRPAGRRGPGRPPGRKAGLGPRKRGGRSRNEHPLHEALHKVLKGRTLGIQEMINAVQKNGFRTTSKSFRTMVSIALGKHRKLFKRVGRGQYTAK